MCIIFSKCLGLKLIIDIYTQLKTKLNMTLISRA